MGELPKVAIARIKLWWHCLWRFHRMEDAKVLGPTMRWSTTWVGCADCRIGYYGSRPNWLDSNH